MAQTELERLLKEFPNLDYANSNIYKSKRHTIPLLEDKDAEAVIAEYYDNSEIVEDDGSGNPETEVVREVNGHVFIEYAWAGDYERAFNEARNFLKK